MAAEVEPQRLLLAAEQLVRRVLPAADDLHPGGLGLAGKEAHLAGGLVPALEGRCLHDPLTGVVHLFPGVPQPVQGAAVNQGFQRPAVQLPPVHPGAEVQHPGEGAAPLPLGGELVDDAPAQPLDSQQAEADGVALAPEPGHAVVDVGRQDGDAPLPALAQVFQQLAGVFQHRCEQRCHVGLGVVAFQVGGLVADQGIGGGVGLVEGVLGKVRHLVEDFIGHLPGDTLSQRAGNGGGTVAVVLAANEDLPLRRHDVGLFLGHGLPDQVGPAVGVARQPAADLHDLFLIEQAAVGAAENRLQQRVQVVGTGGILAVFQEDRNGGGRTGPVDGGGSGQVLDGTGLHLDEHLPHPRRFKLEDALGLPPGEHTEDLLVVQRNFVHLKIRVGAAHLLLAVVDDGQVAQPQKVHFEKPQLLQGGHGVLGDDGVLAPLQRDVVRHRTGSDNHTGRMGGGVAGHALHPAGHLHQPGDLLAALHHLPQDGRLLHRPFQRHLEPEGHRPGHLVHRLIAHAQRPAHVPDGAPGRHGAEGDDLGHMVGAVLPHHIVDDLLPPFVAEVHVKVGHADPFGVEEPFKDQLVVNGVHAGDADTVGNQASRA